ncbi:succinylglutamate desuccinylase/aspartoacylase family protein [Halegenticoccus tardaugens]|uniref:succinylglutamate desuccinylase/aspartoacylase family protein n=1 Tax=Halegenticoccus tardaugens TaxID=2071624 RepID=UPI00100AA86D|nr:succinylglutamate desuccinylase/aspartoacylase family protein [Halegenticoccus tardaugens]
MRRRSFLARALGGVGAAVPFVGAGPSRFGDAGDVGRATTTNGAGAERSREKILDGTRHETEVVVVDAPEPGPTAMVFGGVHGNERSGYLAAADVAEWSFEAGTLVAVPEANRVAIERDERHGVGGDLNRQFPPGEEPTTELARALWGTVERHDPDVVFDLHWARGIYGTHRGQVGQAVFPTDVGDAVAYADAAIGHLNDERVPWAMPFHRFQRGNVIDGDAPLLVHKVAGDLGRAGYIIEATTFLLDVRTRIRWTKLLVSALLTQHGLAHAPDVTVPEGAFDG